MNAKLKIIASYTLAIIIVGLALYVLEWLLKPVLGLTSHSEIISIVVIPGLFSGIVVPSLVSLFTMKKGRTKHLLSKKVKKGFYPIQLKFFL